MEHRETTDFPKNRPRAIEKRTAPPAKLKALLSDARTIWAVGGFIVMVFASGFFFRDRITSVVLRAAFGAEAEGIKAAPKRLDRVEWNQQLIDSKLDDQHEEIRDLRIDMRTVYGDRLKPIPKESPWPTVYPPSAMPTDVPHDPPGP